MKSAPETLSTDLPNTDAWPSSAAFDLIREALSVDAERKDAIKKGGSSFAFALKNDKGEVKEWFIDLKESGAVGKGSAPEGKKADSKTASSLQSAGRNKNANILWLQLHLDSPTSTSRSWSQAKPTHKSSG